MKDSLQRLSFALAIAALTIFPWWGNSYQISFLTSILVWALYALSFDLLFGYTGLLSLGHSVYFGLGAYGAALAIKQLHLSLWLALLVGMGIALLAAIAIGLFVVRVKSHGFIIITAVTSLVFYLLAQSGRELTHGNDGFSFTTPPIVFGFVDWSFSNPIVRFYFALIIVTLAFLALWWLVRTPLGQAFRLIRENEVRAEIIGYPVTQLKFMAFVIAGTFAGFAGAVYALTNRFVSTELFHWTISADAIIWTLFGGAGTLIGPVVGTGLLFWVKEWLSEVWKTGYPLLVGLVILLLIRFAPDGLVGLARRLIGRRNST
ncbi:branched-chain amino acid ABC transporter permease [Candidatus Acetothermia bacterium]|nr:branched-chain amino acid ABC transporter permease [Candidatus Acetothermia bacterium]